MSAPYVPPPPAPPKKSRWWLWILVGVVAVFVANSLIETGQRVERERFNETMDEVIDDSTLSDETSMAVLRIAWNSELTATDRADICDYYNTPPVGTTPEMVQIFADAAEVSYDEADRLLGQLLAEEC